VRCPLPLFHQIVRLAQEKPELRPFLLPLLEKARTASVQERVAVEFPNQKALDKYLKAHPKADPKNHSVKRQDKKRPAGKGTKGNGFNPLKKPDAEVKRALEADPAIADVEFDRETDPGRMTVSGCNPDLHDFELWELTHVEPATRRKHNKGLKTTGDRLIALLKKQMGEDAKGMNFVAEPGDYARVTVYIEPKKEEPKKEEPKPAKRKGPKATYSEKSKEIRYTVKGKVRKVPIKSALKHILTLTGLPVEDLGNPEALKSIAEDAKEDLEAARDARAEVTQYQWGHPLPRGATQGEADRYRNAPSEAFSSHLKYYAKTPNLRKIEDSYQKQEALEDVVALYKAAQA